MQTQVISEMRHIFLPPWLPYRKIQRAAYNNQTIFNWLNENTVSYNTVINNDHSLDLLGGFTFQHENNDFGYMRANSFPTDGVQTLNGGAVLPTGSGTTKSEWAIVSYLARANYSYKGKYLLTATYRTDGSSPVRHK